METVLCEKYKHVVGIHTTCAEGQGYPYVRICFNILKSKFFGSKKLPVRWTNEGSEEFIQKLHAAVKAFEDKNGWSLCVYLKEEPDHPCKYQVRVYGFLSENPELLGLLDFKLRLQLCFVDYKDKFIDHLFAEIPFSSLFTPRPGDIDLEVGSSPTDKAYYQANEILCPGLMQKLVIKHFKGLTSGVFVYPTLMLLPDSSTSQVTSICRKILNEKVLTDVVLESKNGKEFTCSKVFLAAHSTVFNAMLEAKMKELETGRIILADMSSGSVQALLDYMHTAELTQAKEQSGIALELLQAGHKYDMEELEKRVSSIVMGKPMRWFSLNVAFKLFLFARKVDYLEGVKMKAAVVLMAQPENFMKCKAYKEECKINPVQAADAVGELFCLSRRR